MTMPGSRPDEAELILRNGNILTVDSEFSVARALAVKDGIITAVGSESAVGTFSGKRTIVVDLAGRTVIPGITDGHAHLACRELEEVYPSITGLSTSEVIEAIAKLAEQTPRGEWIVTGPMGSPPLFDDVANLHAMGQLPTRWDLDKGAPDNPVYIKPANTNRPPIISIANSMALQRAGVDRDTLPPYSRLVIEHDDTGEPTGRFIETDPSGLLNMPVQEMTVMRAAPQLTMNDRRQALRRALKQFHRHGTTSIFEGHGVTGPIARLFVEAHAANELTMRTHLVVSPPAGRPVSAFEADLRDWGHAAIGFGDDILSVDGIHLSLDGDPERASLRAEAGAYTGYADSYADGPDAREYREKVLIAARVGVRVVSISVGEARLDATLDIWEEADRLSGIRDRGWVLQHLYDVSQTQAQRIARLGVMATVLPTSSLWRGGSRRAAALPESRRGLAAAYRLMMDNGLRLTAGTDGVPPSSLLGLGTMVTRIVRDGARVAPEQAISRVEALTIVTANGPRLTFEGDRKGSIEAGKVADLVVLDRDVMSVADTAISDARSLLTMVGGRVVHDSPELPKGVFDG